MKRLFKVAAALSFMPAIAGAQEFVYTTPIAATGAGLGNRITALTLQSPANSSDATGCISPAGTSGCGYADADVQTQSFVRNVSELGGGTGDLGTDLRIIANFAEPAGNSATINSFTLTLYNAAGDAYTSDFMFDGPLTFPETGTGVGSEGFAFRLNADAAVIFNTAVAAGYTNIGLGASLSDVTGSNDTFSLQRINSTTTSVVPEPSTYALMAAGLAGLFVARRRRNRA